MMRLFPFMLDEKLNLKSSALHTTSGKPRREAIKQSVATNYRFLFTCFLNDNN